MFIPERSRLKDDYRMNFGTLGAILHTLLVPHPAAGGISRKRVGPIGPSEMGFRGLYVAEVELDVLP